MEGILHHTGGTYANPLADTSHHTFKIVDDYHRGLWKGTTKSTLGHYMGYHYFIDREGVTTQARQDHEIGAHTIGHNHKIGICLAGNFDLSYPSERQRIALKILLSRLKAEGKVTTIVPHRKYAPKTCYGMNLDINWAQKLMDEPIVKMLVITDKPRDFSYVIEWYKLKGVLLQLDALVLDFQPTWKEGDIVDEWSVDCDYVDRKLAHYGSGYDFVALVMEKEKWERGHSNGYAERKPRLGQRRCVVVDQERPRDYYDSSLEPVPQYASTLIHESSHMLFRACGQYDQTHALDQAGALQNAKFQLHRFKGWKIKDGKRLFKTTRKGDIIMKIIKRSQWGMYNSGLDYWKRAGGYSEIIPLT